MQDGALFKNFLGADSSFHLRHWRALGMVLELTAETSLASHRRLLSFAVRAGHPSSLLHCFSDINYLCISANSEQGASRIVVKGHPRHIALTRYAGIMPRTENINIEPSTKNPVIPNDQWIKKAFHCLTILYNGIHSKNNLSLSLI